MTLARRRPSWGQKEPYRLSKPEPLRHVLFGAWSRRIADEHRLVCLIDGDEEVILQARNHD